MNATTPLHYRDMNPRQRAASDMTCADPRLVHPRAVELRAQRAETLRESVTTLSAHQLTEALAEITPVNVTPTPAPQPTVRIAIPATIDHLTDADTLRLALIARIPIKAAAVRYEGVHLDAP